MAPPRKGTDPVRRTSSTLSKVATPPNSSRASKTAKQSLVVRFNLPSASLSKFPHEAPPQKPPPSKASSSSTSTPTASSQPVPLTDVKSDQDSTPQPAPSEEKLETPVESDQAKPSVPSKAGVKRDAEQALDGPPVSKGRGRFGPRKKVKVENDATTNGDGTLKPPAAAPVPAHKLGPKANQGAINAGLRALDRTGKPCRKWQKSGFNLKTFTGVTWAIPSWGTHKKLKLGSEVGMTDVSSNSQSKENNSSSNVGSDPSQLDDTAVGNLASSPPTVAAV